MAGFLEDDVLENRHQIGGEHVELRREPEEPRAHEEIDAFLVAEDHEILFARRQQVGRVDLSRRQAVAVDEVRNEPRMPRLLGALQQDRFANDGVFERLAKRGNHDPSLALHCFCDAPERDRAQALKILRLDNRPSQLLGFVGAISGDERAAKEIAMFG